jgi:nitroimidazol reductase NimA-like FMN-containing flavoprotein (pyridoxamine 5'-phosphate oxidase superfamily)/ribosomal protein S18 acetylase RimI-like enzyme
MDQCRRKLTSMEEPSPSCLSGPSVRLKRHPERGDHERATVFAIIDEAVLGHVAFDIDGVAMSLPTAHARVDDQLYLHGARANRMLRALCGGARASVTFTLVDGLVLARTAFHHSMNFRSAVVFGPAREVVDRDEKRLALHALIEHMAPGRMRELGAPSPDELDKTLVLCLTIEEASAKVRRGDPLDAPGDLALDVWAGTVPLALTPAAPKPDPALRPEQTFSAAAAARALARVAERDGAHGEVTLSNDPGRLHFEYIYRFLRDEAYWSRGIERAQLRTAMQNSLCFGAYLGGEQVGFARVVSDRGRFAYRCDVFVDATQRGRGIGEALVSFALDDPGVREVDRVLLGTRDAHSLYERFGFIRTAPGRFMMRQQKVQARAADQPEAQK